MQNLKYTKAEIAEFKKALDVVIDDLESLWQIGALNKIKINAVLPGFSECDESYTNNAWYFIMDQEAFYLEQINPGVTDLYYFAKRKANGNLEKITTINDQDVIFLRSYDEIRKGIVEQIEKALLQKGKNLEIAKKLTRKYSKEATIEIEMPPTINQHTIDVKTENGQQIGIIKFGNIALKIITDESIEIKQNAKVKKKIGD